MSGTRPQRYHLDDLLESGWGKVLQSRPNHMRKTEVPSRRPQFVPDDGWRQADLPARAGRPFL